MLNHNDKKWITETIDEKLYGTKTELRGEMQEMKTGIATELRGEMQEMKTGIVTQLRGEMQEMGTGIVTQLRGEMQEMKEEIITQVTFVIENTIGEDMKFIRENVPDITRSYDLIMDNQIQQQEDVKLLKTISTDHESRINKLEKVIV